MRNLYLPFCLSILLCCHLHAAPGDPPHTAPVPGCAEPSGFQIAEARHNALKVRWDSAWAGTLRFELAIAKKSDPSRPMLKNPLRVAAGNTWTFDDLALHTEYDLYIRRVCQGPQPDDIGYSEWVRIAGKTSAYIPSDCSLDTTLIAVGNITHNRFGIALSPRRSLSATGRRLLVRYRLVDVPAGNAAPPVLGFWQQRLVYSLDQMFVDQLYQGGTYEVYVRQLRDGAYMDYNFACEEVGPFLVTLSSFQNDCGYASQVTPVCVGADFITLQFDGPALGYDDLRYLVALKPLSGSGDWQFYYHFSGAEMRIGNLEEQTEYQVAAYLLVGQSGFSYDYICSETIVENVTTLPRSSIVDTDGDGLPDDCDPDNNDGPLGDIDNDGIINQEDEDVPDTPIPGMPELACGLAANIPAPDPAQLLDEAAEGEIFFINGFPILLTQVWGGNGYFSGEGIIGLPFSTRYLRVDFQQVAVDTQRAIISGVVNGISENLGNYPDLSLDTITFGESNFCHALPEEEGFDENGNWSSTNNPYNPLGFGADGQYQMPPYQGWEPGDPYDPNYDPNGFDENGIHIETGTPFNPGGCSQLGFDAQGQPCNPSGSGPYYWLDPASTIEGIALANEVEDSIRPLVLAYLGVLAQQTNDSIQATKIRCDLSRDTMREHFYALGYTDDRDRMFIFGPGDKWFKEGMSREFKEKPEILGINTDRNPGEEALEVTHINLYNCDVDLMRYEAILAIIGQLQEEPGISESVAHLIKLIKQFSPDEANYYADMGNLEKWVDEKVDSIVAAEYKALHETGGIDGYQSEGARWTSLGRSNTRGVNTSVSLAGTGTDRTLEALLMRQASETRWEDISFAYHQGWQQINGIDRAYFLEAIDKAREKQFGPGDTDYPVSLLPLKLSRDVFGQTYTLYLDNVSFTPQGGTADIYIIINTTPSPDRLLFKALKVPFGPSGFIGDTRLLLGTDISITLNNATKLNLLGNNNTYVSFDCDGFSGMSVDGEVEFCRNYIIPLYPGTLAPKPETESVKAHFLVQMPAWGEFVVELDVDPFALTQHDSIKWLVQDLVFDFSSSITPGYIAFPPNYTSPFVQHNNGVTTASGLWKGFYAAEISVTLPRQISTGSGADITVGAKDLIFDDRGLTGEVFASPLLTLCEGNLGGWAFSIDTFALQVTSNRLDGFKFNGLLNLPILTGASGGCALPSECIRYEAAVLPGNLYSFSVMPLGVYQADVWKASVIINPDSEIEIKYQNGSFEAKAVLNGSVTIDGDLGQNFVAEIPGITFQNLVLRNNKPYFEPGLWSVPNASAGVGFGGFEITIDSIKMVGVPNTDDRANLKFRAGIIIVEEDMGLLMVDGGFQLKGKLLVQNNRQRWVYDGLMIDDVYIDASFPGVDRVHGKLAFFGQDQPHASLGRGFSGAVYVDFQGVDVELMALGVFGNTGAFKYFMIDALARFNPGVGAGVLQLIGFGGGASYHMDIIGDLDTGLPPNISNVDPLAVALGSSLSGLVYAPDVDRGINIHATVVMALAKEEAFNVNATFGVSFYSGGGLDEVYFKGTGRFMDAVNFSAPPTYLDSLLPNLPTEICAFVYMRYAFAEKEFHGNFRVNINVAGILHGHGDAELMIRPGYWFINVGTPQKPIRVAFTIPKLKMTLAEVDFYFDIGKNIPSFPGLPGNVSSLTGLGNIVANEALRRTGNGFATGMRFDATTGDLKFLIFYARFDLGLGFDIMLQDYGNATCANNNGEPLGINGWYASGQLWAYVQGKVGIRVRLWGKKRDFEILSLSVAAALQAKFPNPFYARGAVGGRYRILGGLIKGKCRFEFSFGEECQIIGGSDPWEDQEVILALSPVDSLESVHTLTIPKANFTVPINEDLSDGTNVWRAEIIYASIISDGLVLFDEDALTEGRTVLEAKPVNALPANKWLVFKVKAQVLKNGEFFKFEEKEVVFKTGNSPDIIPVDNVKHAYPIDGQFNFYRNEHPDGKGFIVLKFGQPELFQQDPPGYVREMHLTRLSDGSVVKFPFAYIDYKRKIEFTMPSLDPGETYRLEMVNNNIDGLVGSDNAGSEGGDAESDPEDVPGVMYQVHFRVSNYAKFADKVEALKQNLQVVSYSTGWIRANSTLDEPLDYFEIYGKDEGEELVSTTLDLNSLNWFNQNKTYLKLVYNYGQEPINNSDFCYLSQFTNKYNSFDQQNFSNAPIGFDESIENPVLAVSYDGSVPPNSDSIIQSLDFTSLNAFSVMWGDMKMDLLSYKTMKCSGMNWLGQSATGCGNFSYCCTNGSQQGCCTLNCAFEGNPYLVTIADNDMPVLPSGSKFLTNIRYRIPGLGLTTDKVIELTKP
ncbi:MAG: hypothetical protein R2791_15615 [Saprospiraceae bacterium]